MRIKVVDPMPGYFMHGPYREIVFATKTEAEGLALASSLIQYLQRCGIFSGNTLGYIGVYFDPVGVDLVELWCQARNLTPSKEIDA
jgi:hypothetical protein